MTQPDASQPVAPQPVQQQPVQPVPGGDLPTVGTPETPVEGTFANAGQPTEAVEDQYVAPTDPADPNYQGLVSVRNTGETYNQDGFYIEAGETKTFNAEDARTLLNGGNGSFEVV